MTPEHPEAQRESVESANPNWEHACIVQLEQGNPDGFNDLVQHYSSRIYSHLYRMMRNREEAEDLTQDTFILAYRKINSYDHARPFRNWLYTIATNVGRNAFRTKGRRIPSVQVEAGPEAASHADRNAHPSEQNELKDRLASVVNELPEPLPMLIQLYYQEGFTVREAADVLGMSESAAKVALHRARKTLRTMLEKDNT
jgi:RNA polymerase sigma-70 factor (ECF subfamily)